MPYENQAKNGSCIEVVNMMAGSKDLSKPMVDELDEVYRKAKAFDEIVIETTGAIMNCPPGAVETEAGRLTLDIIEKYDLEENSNEWSQKRLSTT